MGLLLFFSHLLILFSSFIAAVTTLGPRQNHWVEVHGVQNASIKPRLEIRDLAKNEKLLNLFLLGLERFQAVNQSDVLSYYEIAGIHGVPYRPWQDINPVPSARGPGYCPHWSNIFLSWHRPYLALFEQTLYSHVLAIVAQYLDPNEKDAMRKIADDIRLPYWDWALSTGPVIPDIMSRETVQVVRPMGNNETIRNPLFSYTFQPYIASELNDGFSDVYKFYSTKRTPTSYPNTNPEAPSNLSTAESSFSGGRQEKRDRLYKLMWKENTYSAISNHRGADPNNLEVLHGWAHMTLGGTNGPRGHMTETPMSAFDPAFWLHHAMMDRLVAIWQKLHPGTYVEPQDQAYATWATEANSMVDAQTPLYPFPRSQDAMWTSEDVNGTEIFGYTYSELELKSSEDLKAELNRLYNSATSFGKRDADGTDLDPKADFTEYDANIAVDQFALAESFSIYFFLGSFGAHVQTWDSEENLVGIETILTLGNPGGETFGGALTISGSIPLTRILRQKWKNGQLKALDEECVLPYLAENLHWRVRRSSDGTEVPIEEAPFLNVSIVSAKVRPAQHAGEFPKQLTDDVVHSEVHLHNGLGPTARKTMGS